MNAELEKTVDSVLANGELTDRSRELLMKKAEQLGVDLLDFELELESKIAQKKASTSGPLPIYTSTTPQSNKEGDLKKCPSCGAPVQSFTTKCPECGHEFRNTVADTSISKLFDLLMEAETSAKDNTISGAFGNFLSGRGDATTEKKRNIIANFPIPNSKESILEFLSTAVPKAKKATILDCFNGQERYIRNLFVDAWKSKCQQIIMKARFSMKDDKKTLEEIEVYAKQLGIK
jgi:hypothetical protein